jgi:AcrR family transcriptional regulator
MNNDKQKILKTACETFFAHGFYKIPVDDIASSLKMSKKTIYKYFPAKEDLVKEVAYLFIKTHSCNISAIINNHEFNAVEKLFYIFKYLGNMLINISDKWFSDIQSQAPEIWTEIEAFRSRFMTQNISRIIEQGKKEKYIDDYSSLIMINVFISSIRGIINPEFITNNKMPAFKALESTLDILMNGILTPKGKNLLKKLKMEKA